MRSKPRVDGLAALPRTVTHALETALEGPLSGFAAIAQGASPGVKGIVTTTAGATGFLKAVTAERSVEAASRLRSEIRLLTWMPTSALRPTVLASGTDANWTWGLLAAVPGVHPSFGSRAERDRLLHWAAEQSRQLAVPPPSLRPKSLSRSWLGWLAIWERILAEPGRYLPTELTREPVMAKLRAFPLALLADETICHWDLAPENILVAGDAPPVFVDWGLARVGPRWADSFRLMLGWAETPFFAESMNTLASAYKLDPAWLGAMLVALTGVKSWNRSHRSRAGLEWDRDAEDVQIERLLQGVRSYLGETPWERSAH